MMQGDKASATESEPWASPDGLPHFAPKAKRVIWIFMIGGVSHVESFDPKPEINKYADKTIAETPYKDALVSPLVKEKRSGDCGRPKNHVEPVRHADRSPQTRRERHRSL